MVFFFESCVSVKHTLEKVIKENLKFLHHYPGKDELVHSLVEADKVEVKLIPFYVFELRAPFRFSAQFALLTSAHLFMQPIHVFVCQQGRKVKWNHMMCKHGLAAA